MKVIGIVTAGGDAPGMNAAIRAAVRIASSKNYEVLGFERGWEGLLLNRYRQLTSRSVSGILHVGGTILHTARSSEFKQDEGVRKAARTLLEHKIEGLVVIGGDGSLRGASHLSKMIDIPIVCIPASIDNDIFGTDETIGFDTAVNTAIGEIDKIRDTAVSLDRIFVVEVMGRTRGFLAVTIGITVGAEMILVPEEKNDIDGIISTIRQYKEKGKRSAIIVAAEGIGDTRQLANELEKSIGAEVRLTVLGYTQRGGNPSARSRLLASLFADEAIELISKGEGNRVVVLNRGEVTSIGLEESCKTKKPFGFTLLDLSKKLSA